MRALTGAAVQTVAVMALLLMGAAHLIAGDKITGAVVMVATIALIIAM